MAKKKEIIKKDTVPDLTFEEIIDRIRPEGQEIWNPQIYGGRMEGAQYRSAISGARVEVFPENDPTIGFRIINDVGDDVFKALVGGSDVGDVVMGNFSGGKGAKWDKSAGTFTIAGAIATGNMNADNVETSIFSTNRGGDSEVNITQGSLNVSIFDVNGAAVFHAVGKTFSNGILHLDTRTHDVEALTLETRLVTATAETAKFTNVGLSEILILEATNVSNTDTILKTIGSGPTWHAEFGGPVKIVAELQIDIDNSDNEAIDINSSRQNSAITINETATAGIAPIINIVSARPARGIFLDLNHTTNNKRGIDLRYAGLGLATEGIIHITAENASAVGACLVLDHGGVGTHINFSGDPANSSPIDGDLWFDGSDLKLRIGATTYTLDKTSV